MKKLATFLLLLIMLSATCFVSAFGADDNEWETMPIITSLYEVAKEKVFLEWEGYADLYQVYVDGKATVTVNICCTVVDIKAGTHQIIVAPAKYESKGVNTEIILPEISLPSIIGGTIIGGGNIDLAAFGLDPKNLVYGTHSELFKFDYLPNKVFDAKPVINSAATDFCDNVVLDLTDNYDSDIYRVYIRSKKDTAYVDFDISDDEAASLISKDKSSVSIVLDQDYLKEHGCSIIPDLDKKYSFSVRLRKRPINQVSGKKEPSSFLESKESSSYDFTPFAAWKYAPEITYHSQTADGEITLKWEHDDNGLGCEYKILKLDKSFVVKKKMEVIGIASTTEFVVKDLSNGKYTFAVIPVYSGNEGEASREVTEEVKNEWVVAPTLACTASGTNKVLLSWQNAVGIESYHITVSLGSGSLLRFVNLDYKRYDELDVPASGEKTEYLYTLNQSENDGGIRLKFEIYGIRHSENGEIQQSATTTQTIVLK